MKHFEHISDLPVTVSATCDAPPVSLAGILLLRVGDVVPCLLHHGASVSLVAEGTVIGKGELALSGDQVVLRVTALGRQS